MKKSYKKPKAKAVKVSVSHLLTDSSPIGGRDEKPFLAPNIRKKPLEDEFDFSENE